MIICLILVCVAVWLAYGPIIAAREYAGRQTRALDRLDVELETAKNKKDRDGDDSAIVKPQSDKTSEVLV